MRVDFFTGMACTADRTVPASRVGLWIFTLSQQVRAIHTNMALIRQTYKILKGLTARCIQLARLQKEHSQPREGTAQQAAALFAPQSLSRSLRSTWPVRLAIGSARALVRPEVVAEFHHPTQTEEDLDRFAGGSRFARGTGQTLLRAVGRYGKSAIVPTQGGGLGSSPVPTKCVCSTPTWPRSKHR